MKALCGKLFFFIVLYSGKDIMAEHKILLKEDRKQLAAFRLIDDDFFSEVLDGNVEAVQYILDTVLGTGVLTVVHTESQAAYKSSLKRTAILDVKAIGRDNEVVDIEIQRAKTGADPKRARFHSGIIDRTLLEKGQKFREMPDLYIIFITEEDFYKRGFPLYHVSNTIMELDHQEFGDGVRIIYVNGEYRGKEHPVGNLMHDFFCSDPNEMHDTVLKRDVRYMKESEEGRTHMGEIFDKIRKESEIRAKSEDIIKVMESFDVSLERAMDVLEIRKEDRAMYEEYIEDMKQMPA